MKVFRILLEIIKNFSLIKRMMLDKEVSFFKKALIVLGIAYLVLPFEIIPDILLPFGFVDDIILWLLIMYVLNGTMKKYKEEDFARGGPVKYKRGNIIDNVYYEVKSEKTEESKVEKREKGEKSGERNLNN